jgi:HEAT repeat protein
VLPPSGSDTKPAPKGETKPRGRPTVPDLSRAETSISQAPASIAEALSRSAPSHAAPEAGAGFSPEFGTRPGFGSALSAKSGTTPPLPTPATPPVASPDAPATFATSTPAAPSSAPSSQRLKLVPEQLDAPDYGGEDISIEAELSDDDIDDAWDYGLDEPPPSRAEVYSARPLAAPGDTSELKLPSVIVDLANECRALLEYLLEGDESAADRLVEMGTAAVTVLVNAFPGPLRHPSLRPGSEPSKASECGPVLKTLYRLGSKSVPFLVVRTNDGDPEVRRWSAHLLGELPSPESTHAVARRFFDTDEAVRRAALGAARLLLAHPDFGPQLINEFAELAEDRAKGMGMRLASIEALADLRHPLAVPALIRVLTDGAPDIEDAARGALVVVARQDFGTQAAAWAEWWRGNGGRHRVEWLIDALTHESQDVRRTAGEELKIVTREYFGYYDDLPARERERAQTRYREWWETRGKARFH